MTTTAAITTLQREDGVRKICGAAELLMVDPNCSAARVREAKSKYFDDPRSTRTVAAVAAVAAMAARRSWDCTTRKGDRRETGQSRQKKIASAKPPVGEGWCEDQESRSGEPEKLGRLERAIGAPTRKGRVDAWVAKDRREREREGGREGEKLGETEQEKEGVCVCV